MGYRSQVIIGIKKKLYRANKKILSILDDADSKEQTREAVYFIYDSVKWYDSYKEVAQINEFINDNADDSCLMRVGEEIGDTEILGNPVDFDLHFTQSIGIPEFLPKTKAAQTLFGE